MSGYSTYIGQLDEKFWESPTPKACWNAIDQYFDFNGVESAHEELWKFTVGMLTNDEIDPVANGRDRHNIIYFYEFTKFLIQVVSVLHTHEKIGKREKKKAKRKEKKKTRGK